MSSVALGQREEELCRPAQLAFERAHAELMQRRGELSAQEEFLTERLREVGRLMLQQWSDAQGPGRVADGRVVCQDGRTLTHERMQTRPISTVFGTIRMGRMGYGTRQQRSVHPLEAQCVVPQRRYSYALQDRACREAVRHAYDDATASIQSYLGVQIPKRQLLQLVSDVAKHMEPFYAAQHVAPCVNDEVLVMSMDGKGLVMRRDDLRAETRRKQATLTTKHRHRLCKGEKPYRKRIATVASVYQLHRQPRTVQQVLQPHEATANQPRARHKRVWADVANEVQHVADQVVAEAKRRLGPQTEVVFISDGDHRMRKPMKKALKVCEGTVLAPDKVTFVVDVIHALERLWTAAHALFGEGDPQVEPWVTREFERLLHGRASAVAQQMRRKATQLQLRGNRRKKLDRAAQYLIKYKAHMHYDQYLAKGYPIASGVIEGACKHLVKDRCERSGARWSLHGADALLKLRSVFLSGHWQSFWRYYIQQDQSARWRGFSWQSLDAKSNARPHFTLIPGGKPSS